MGEYAEYGFDQQGWCGTFVACGIWCLADVSSVSPSSEQTFSFAYRRADSQNVKPNLMAINIYYLNACWSEPVLYPAQYSPLRRKTVLFFKSSLQVISSSFVASWISTACHGILPFRFLSMALYTRSDKFLSRSKIGRNWRHKDHLSGLLFTYWHSVYQEDQITFLCTHKNEHIATHILYVLRWCSNKFAFQDSLVCPIARLDAWKYWYEDKRVKNKYQIFSLAWTSLY